MTPPAERWLDREAGPVVRPYAMTRGRTRPEGAGFELIAVVSATGVPAGDRLRYSPDHARVLRGCARPVPVVDLAADLGLPIGVVRVLLGDLRDEGLVAVVAEAQPATAGRRPPKGVLREVLNGLRAL
ncbi:MULTISPECIES: DUF742 domain-containing protein [Actinomadura]|uniref:DUF742 domain-containing protein n=1 Tax=Actinomadura madurae TaxID=1993 RepID=A0A1I5IWF9_9ACTN|nr:DUF742 domain-containing protein [Actinomadura madurae]MCP9983389.1 DUF742 domain-containing protein [Actinomadura madurae]URM99651.1 DUF742 domain-containing protein [Actinomadura madurae]URN10318.1 DUF742 domain-containing protein [Actinomadura madurae]SFO64857.1 Protein of unknown function [Actinomadura madurae]SPT58465.1 Protein of uncharacterised function (DUF742) [Actinomadura madurae]